MKRLTIMAAALILSAGVLTSCKKEMVIKLKPPVMQLAGFKKDISTAD